jgi:hypothetical protein
VRRIGVVAVVVAVVLLLLPAGATTSSARPSGRILHATFIYMGSYQGYMNGWARPNPWMPIVVVGQYVDHYSWAFGCDTDAALAGSFQGQELHCDAQLGSISGQANFTDVYKPTNSCFASLSKVPGSSLGMGGIFQTKGGGVLTVYASPPLAQIAFTPPSCQALPEQIHWLGSVNTKATTPDLFANPNAVVSQTTHGVYDHQDESGQGTEVSSLAVNLQSILIPPLVVWAKVLAHWVFSTSDTIDQPGNAETPTIFSAQTGGMSATVKGGDPVLLFSLHQTLHPGLNKLHLTVTPAMRAFVTGLTDAPTLSVQLSFTPTNGKPASLTTTIKGPPPLARITGVSFSGSPADPTIAIHGRGFGSIPAKDPAGALPGQAGCPAAPGTYGSDYGANLALADLTSNWTAGRHLPGISETDCIGLIPTKYTATEIDLRLGSFYTANQPKFSLNSGDSVQLLANGAVANVHVAYGSTVTK